MYQALMSIKIDEAHLYNLMWSFSTLTSLTFHKALVLELIVGQLKVNQELK